MKFNFPALHRSVGAAVLLTLAQAAHAAPASHTTTLLLTAPLKNPDGISKVVFDWTSNVTTGHVGAADLVDFSMSLFAGAASIYTDKVIANGVVQAFGGAARGTAEPYWNFDLTANILSEVRNVFGSESASTGTQYAVSDNLAIPVDGQLGISKYTNGTGVYQVTELVGSQSTIPEPSTLALIALAGAGLTFSRKRAS